MKTGRLMLCLGLLAILYAALPLAAQENPAFGVGRRYWTSIGATGIPDESSAANTITNDTASIAIRPDVRTATIWVRYNVTAVEGLTYDDPSTASPVCLYMTARDLGSTDRVRLRLKTADRTGIAATMATIDSDAFPGGGSDAYRQMGTCTMSSPYEPTSHVYSLSFVFGRVYWLEAEMTKYSLSGNPGIKLIWMGREPDL